MKNFRFLILFSLIFGFFFSCSLINLNKNNGELYITLPQTSANRAIEYKLEDSSINFSENGKLKIEYIDEYEITITSSDGETLTKNPAANEKSVTFSDIAIGKWTVNFNAYAKDKNGKNALVAKNRNPIEVDIVENAPTTVDILAELVKYDYHTYINKLYKTMSNKKVPLIGNYDNLVPITDLYLFEPAEGNINDIFKISDDGYIIPLKAGDITMKYTRLLDGTFGTFNVMIYPVYRISINYEGTSCEPFVVDDNTSFNIPSYFKEENNFAEAFSLYYDSEYKIPVDYDVERDYFDFSSWVEENEETFNSPIIELPLYAKSNVIKSNDDLINAFTNGGNYFIDGSETSDFTITSELNVSNALTITFKGDVTIKRGSSYKSTMVNVKNNSSLTIQPDATTPEAYFHWDGSLPENDTVTSKIMEINSSGNSSFTNVVFEKNNQNQNYAAPSAIFIQGSGNNLFTNCKIENNSISGSNSRSPGIKIEKANVTIDGMKFSNNSCSSFNYGLDIWIENSDAQIIFKGKFENSAGISLHYKAQSTNNNPIDVNGIENDNNIFKVTYSNYGDNCSKPSNGIQIFNFGENGDTLKDKFKLCNYNNSNLEQYTDIELDSDGKVSSTN